MRACNAESAHTGAICAKRMLNKIVYNIYIIYSPCVYDRLPGLIYALIECARKFQIIVRYMFSKRCVLSIVIGILLAHRLLGDRARNK